ncbi:MAG: hypothetical protein EBY39_03070 [Flavobacteriia bacterium]|nr:hypothetical protein [Flavobacteriia bacterium]
MRREVQIEVNKYIDPLDFTDAERIELFEDETITLTQTIQNVKDIGSIFTDFSQSFSVPASPTNNKIFEHYYNMDIETSFNANDKLPARILLNSDPFRQGYLALDSVQMKDNNPHTYKVTFFGETVDIKKQLKDITLRNLFEGFSNYDHAYNNSTIYFGLSSQLFSGRIIYPLISHTERFYYDSSTSSAGSRNLHYNSSVNQGIDFRDLKPALQVRAIIQRINAVTDLEFDESFFFDDQNDDYMDLYLWLSRERGALGQSYTGGQQFNMIIDSLSSFYGDFNLVSGFSVANPTVQISSISNGLITCTPYWFTTTNYSFFEFNFLVNSTSTYDVYIEEISQGVTVLASAQNVTGAVNIGTGQNQLRATSSNQSPTYIIRLRIATQDATFVATSMELQCNYRERSGRPTRKYESDTTTISPNALVNNIVVSEQMPNMLVIDFLKGLFKMHNLTAFFGSDGTIKVKTLDNFYASGTEYDISDYVDVTEKEVSYPIPYQEIAFRFLEPKTFLATNFFEINGYKYGDLENTTTRGDVQQTDRGDKYVVQLPFEKMVYERLSDQATNTLLPIQYGWSVDKDQNPVAVQPMLFYRKLQYVSSGGQRPSYQQNTTPISLSTYNRPANTELHGTMNFNTEVDEFTGTVDTNSLFQRFYSNYVSGVFSRQRRLIKVTAYLPLKILLEYGLEDRFIINGRRYMINSIKTNLQTGKSELELFNEVYPT